MQPGTSLICHRVCSYVQCVQRIVPSSFGSGGGHLIYWNILIKKWFHCFQLVHRPVEKWICIIKRVVERKFAIAIPLHKPGIIITNIVIAQLESSLENLYTSSSEHSHDYLLLLFPRFYLLQFTQKFYFLKRETVHSFEILRHIGTSGRAL